jgi:hypothetical protein
MGSHRLKAASHLVVPNWPSYTGTSKFVGTSPVSGINVWVDPSLGTPALLNAQWLVSDADRIATATATFFNSKVSPVNVILFALDGQTDGTGGADHMGCDFNTGGDIEVCVSYGQNLRVSALFEAELSECAMNGNLCGLSTGEALSRWCAMEVSNNALSDFVSVPSWVQAGFPNWVDNTKQTDGDYPSIGCGMAFISWVLSQGGPAFYDVARTMVRLGDSGTLTKLYQALTGLTSSPWAQFLSAIKALPGSALSTDNPFGVPLSVPVPTPPPPVPQPPPPVPPPPVPPPPPPPPVPVPKPTIVTVAGSIVFEQPTAKRIPFSFHTISEPMD